MTKMGQNLSMIPQNLQRDSSDLEGSSDKIARIAMMELCDSTLLPKTSAYSNYQNAKIAESINIFLSLAFNQLEKFILIDAL